MRCSVIPTLMSERGSQRYFRPIPVQAGRKGRWPLAGGSGTYSEIEVLHRDGGAEIVPRDAVEMLYPDAAATLVRVETAPAPVCGLALSQVRIMGIVNVTPDSFSDGGRFGSIRDAVAHAMTLARQGADILDIGGESTRPGAEPVTRQEELDRVIPVIEGLVAEGCPSSISIDTRHSAIAREALAAGAVLFNDVSALSHDHDSLATARSAGAVCLMHAQGDPRTMQDAPRYDDVLLDVYDYLSSRVAACEAAGIERTRLIVDPGIGFGKTLAHNLKLLRGLSLFHGIGCAVMLGASRKGFIGKLSGETSADRRAPGSIAVALAAIAQGVQIVRVHDVAEHVQAIKVWQALNEAES